MGDFSEQCTKFYFQNTQLQLPVSISGSGISKVLQTFYDNLIILDGCDLWAMAKKCLTDITTKEIDITSVGGDSCFCL